MKTFLKRNVLRKNILERRYVKIHFGEDENEPRANHFNLNFLVLKEDRSSKETKEEAGFLNAVKLYKKNDLLVLKGRKIKRKFTL
jgi:hypothetical protein